MDVKAVSIVSIVTIVAIANTVSFAKNVLAVSTATNVKNA
jgi:hypothetical protein